MKLRDVQKELEKMDRHWWRKTKAVQLTATQFGEMVLEYCRNRGIVTPDDVVATDIFDDPWTKDVVVLYHSEEFPARPDGEVIPLWYSTKGDTP